MLTIEHSDPPKGMMMALVRMQVITVPRIVDQAAADRFRAELQRIADETLEFLQSPFYQRCWEEDLAWRKSLPASADVEASDDDA